MRNKVKKVMVSVLAVALLLGVLAVPPQDAQAAGKSYMKGLKLNWDLKKNKAVKFTTSLEVFKKVSRKAEITNYKVKSAGKGYKQLSFNVTFRFEKIKISNAQWKKLRNINRVLRDGTFWYSVADYDTGLSLERKNKFGVKVRSSRWETIKTQTYKKGNQTFELDDRTVKVTITYPEDYDGLCIGVGGQNRIGETRADSSYWRGKTKFGQTSFYKTGKKNSHWMRIRASKKKPESTSKPKTKKTPVPTSSPSGGTPAASVPVSTPSGNTPVISVPTVEPSGGTPATSVPTLTPSGTAMPSPTVDPDTVPTIVLDSGEWESEGYRRMQEMEKKGEYYKVNITCTYYTDHEWVTDDVIVSGNKIPNCDGCIHMIAVTLPDNVDIIGVDTFAGCENLTSIEIPEGVTTIGDQAFLGCSKLSDIKLPSTLLNIATEAFSMCKSLTSIEIPESVTTIGNQAFVGCGSLTDIEIPAGVTNIGGGLFGFPMCEKLTTITVAEGNPVYDSRNGCNAIIRTADNALVSTCNTTILPEGLKKIGAAAFKDGDMISYTIPEGITTIEDQAFRNCRNLTSITIPDSVTSIGSDVFANCSSLPEITIPDGVTSIGECAFADCNSLTSITIPDSVTSIGDGAFSLCRNLTSITWKGTVYTSGESFEAAFRR